MIRIIEGNHTIIKVLFQESKRVDGAMWSSTILHKSYQIELGITLNDLDKITGQHVPVSYTCDSSIHKNGSDYSSGLHCAPDSDVVGIANSFLQNEAILFIHVNIELEMSFITKPNFSYNKKIIVSAVKYIIGKHHSLFNRRNT